ncbi:non-ribosomal peptide synthetase [Catenulispora yoronensis]
MGREQPGHRGGGVRGEKLTYRGLADAAGQVREALRSAGVGPGEPVVVRLAPGLGQMAALLGVLEAGATLVWFGLGDVGSRGRVVLSALRPAALLIDGGQRPDELADWYRGETVGQVVDIAEVLDIAATANTAPPQHTLPTTPPSARTPPPPPPQVRATDRAYIAYTSGSTGTPKGVAQSHAALAQFVTWLADEFALGPGSRVAQWVAPEHDPALAETFAALASGSTLCLVPALIRANPEKLVDWLAAERISMLQTVPSFARELLRVVEAGRAPERMAALAVLLLMGEALPGELVTGLRTALPLARTANLYGPTETIAATWHEVSGPVSGPVPIGRSIPGRQVLVLDDEDRPCPAGVTGNLVIRSPYVADGYLGAPEPGPAFAPLPGFPAVTVDGRPVGCYRTGDLARRLPGGVLEYRGRKDYQIKLYGSRLELADVEAALADHPSVAECAVVAVTDADGFASRLVVHVVPRADPGGRPLGSPDEWRTQLRHRFGRSMLPALFRTLPGRLPRTPAGKVDRARLPDPGAAAGPAGRPLQTPVEKEMAGLWAELTDGVPASAGDTFFAAGGHSLLVLPLLRLIRGRFGVAVSAADFYAHQTLAGLSALVDRSR